MTHFFSNSPSHTKQVAIIIEIMIEIIFFVFISKNMSARHIWHESWDSKPEITNKREVHYE